MADALWDVRLAPRVCRDLERVRDKAILRRLRAAVEGLAVAPYKGKGLTAHPGVRKPLRRHVRRGVPRPLHPPRGRSACPRCHDRPAERCVRSPQALGARTLALPKIARSPHYVLLDEPFSGIDPISIANLQDEIHSLRDRGIGVIITDHNVRNTLSIADCAYLIDHGRLVTSEAPAEIVTDPAARRVYLGEAFQP